MKLINVQTGEPLVTIVPGSPIQFHHEMMDSAMRAFGIVIPLYLQPKFGDKSVVYIH